MTTTKKTKRTKTKTPRPRPLLPKITDRHLEALITAAKIFYANK